MKLLSVLTARALLFLDLRDLNPRGKALRYTLFPAMADKYRFTTYPYDTDDNQPTKEEPGFKFIGGEFRNLSGEDIMVNLTIFDDGLVAETRSSTRDSEAFLENVLQWAVRDFGLVYRPEMIRLRGYLSELCVIPDYSLAGLNAKLEAFAQRLTSLASSSDEPVRFAPAGLLFSPDPSGGQKAATFRFERQLDQPFSTNRHYSQASVHTDVHLDLLNELEQILKGVSD